MQPLLKYQQMLVLQKLLLLTCNVLFDKFLDPVHFSPSTLIIISSYYVFTSIVEENKKAL